MNKEQLQGHLDQLSEMIGGMDANEADKDRLSNLVTDIELRLSDPVSGTDDNSLVDQVDGMVSTFENDHPLVTSVLNNIIVTLTSMGI